MTREELRERQGWSLQQKIDHSLGTIDQFYHRLNGKVYISFSGGKDSTVLYWLARKIFPDIKAVFCNTGNEYPDIVRFVRNMKLDGGGYNIDIIYPAIKPREVMAKHGFPLISKQTSFNINYARRFPNSNRAKQVLGILPSDFDRTCPQKYRYLLDTTYMVTDECCDELKKKPFKRYEKENGVYPIMGVMADESEQRTTDYIKQGGCNVFETKGGRAKSHPLAIWLESDIWECIERYNIPIADIYHKGAKRTGCMFCGYGCQFKNDHRLQLVYENYPKFYNMFMSYENNGVTYREALRDLLRTNGLFLPDEQNQLTLF
jgi:3'-phosphoadenosine 5'-phosphosulfate sulfotransferase (PAPS reductase)/FAD synthetase